MKKTGRLIAVLAMALALPIVAQATVVDLATSADGDTPDTLSGSINNALFVWCDASATGTGLIDPFVRLQATPTEQGYNTTEDSVFDNGNVDTYNHALPVGSAPIVNIGGINYREFLLDLNEPNNGNNALISLYEVQIFLSNTENPAIESFNLGNPNIVDLETIGTLIYDMDAQEDSRVELNAELNSGSGSGDMFMYIPNSLFVGGYQFVYLYSAFGRPNSSSAGFEEWAVQGGSENVVPEPATMSLLGLGLAGMAASRLRKRRQA